MRENQQIQPGQQSDPQPFTGKSCGQSSQIAPGANRARCDHAQQWQQKRRTCAAHASTKHQRAKENQSAYRQPFFPVRHVAHRPGEYALVLPIGIEQAPVAADCAFTAALPRLIERFDQVVTPAFLLGHRHKATNEFCLVDPARYGCFTLTAFARPAGLANHHVFGRELVAEHLTHIRHMPQRHVDVRWIVFPVRQQVNGQKVHGRGDFRMLEPEFPDVGVGHRLLDLAFDLVDQPGQLRAGDLFAQQRFVADDYGCDHVGVGIGRFDQQLDFLLGVDRVAVDPGADHQLQTVLARQIGQGVEAGHRVGADAFKARRQQREVGVHALGAQFERHVERRLVLVERSVGGALQLVRRRRGVRQDHRLAEAIPETAKGQEPEQAGEQIRQKRKSGRCGHGQAEWLQSDACYLHLYKGRWLAGVVHAKFGRIVWRQLIALD